jgi:hypothetical protein
LYCVPKRSVYVADGDVAVMLRGLLVGPSNQLSKTHRTSPPCVAGVPIVHTVPSVHRKDAGAVYVPGLHPVPDVVNCKLETLLSMKIDAVRAEKFAVTVFGPFITIETGLAEPDASPDQFAN